VSEDPTVINTDPYGKGWLLEIEPSSPGEVGGLGAAEYLDLVKRD
jgi:glycine cleavage system H protein